jgi:hypothetical protein
MEEQVMTAAITEEHSPDTSEMTESRKKNVASESLSTAASAIIQEKYSEGTNLTTAEEGCGCGSAVGAAGDAFNFIYSIGNIRPVFPSKSVQNEFNQITGRTGTAVPDNRLIFEVLSQGDNLYLAREMCWVFQVQGVDVYLVKPRTYVELNEIVMSLQPLPGDIKFSAIIGPRGPIAGPEVCNGLQLPMAVCKQFDHFTFNEFVNAIVAETQVDKTVAASMFQQMLQLADNAGETDEHRAINYLTLRYMGLYIMAADMLDPKRTPGAPYSLLGVVIRPSKSQGTRKIMDVIFNYEERDTSEKIYWFCKVDVTGQFPFLVSKLNRYYPTP